MLIPGHVVPEYHVVSAPMLSDQCQSPGRGETGDIQTPDAGHGFLIAQKPGSDENPYLIDQLLCKESPHKTRARFDQNIRRIVSRNQFPQHRSKRHFVVAERDSDEFDSRRFQTGDFFILAVDHRLLAGTNQRTLRGLLNEL